MSFMKQQRRQQISANIHVRMYVEDILPRRAQMLCRTVLLIALNVVSEFWISGALTRTLRRFYTCQATSAVYQRFKPTFILCSIFYPISEWEFIRNSEYLCNLCTSFESRNHRIYKVVTQLLLIKCEIVIRSRSRTTVRGS